MGMHTIGAVLAHTGTLDSKAAETDLRVLIATAGLANDANGTSWAPKTALAATCGIHPNTVSAALKRLIEAGLVQQVQATGERGKEITGYQVLTTCNPACATAAHLHHAPEPATDTETQPQATEENTSPQEEPAPTFDGLRNDPADYINYPAQGNWKPGTPLAKKLRAATIASFHDAWQRFYPSQPKPAKAHTRLTNNTAALYRAAAEQNVETAVEIIRAHIQAVYLLRYYAAAQAQNTGTNPTPSTILSFITDATELITSGVTPEEIKTAAHHMGQTQTTHLNWALENTRKPAAPTTGRVGILEATARAKAAAQSHFQGNNDSLEA